MKTERETPWIQTTVNESRLTRLGVAFIFQIIPDDTNDVVFISHFSEIRVLQSLVAVGRCLQVGALNSLLVAKMHSQSVVGPTSK